MNENKNSSTKKQITAFSVQNTWMRKVRLIVFPALLCGSVIAQPSVATKYINTYKNFAIKLSAETGIPASIILGVAIIESGHGSSKNCLLLKNHFGIVGKNNLAKTQKTYRSVYKEYASNEASFYDFCRVVKNKKYYHLLKGSTNYTMWLNSMNQASYSSAKQIWVKRITEAIEIHKLYKLDKALLTVN